MKKALLIFLALAGWALGALAQPRPVTGQVTAAEDGHPLVSASVVVKGTLTGVKTDANGQYTIVVPGPDALLIFSHPGRNAVEVKAANLETLNVRLEKDPNAVEVEDVAERAKPKPAPAPEPKKKGPHTVTGRVVSAEDGLPLVQATVVIDGTSTGVATDLDGKYSINVPNEDVVLSYSYSGMDPQKIPVAGRNGKIDVVLEPESIDVDEVMVVAFGKTKKSAFTGSAAEVSAKELEKKQVTNVVSALSGKVPGVRISSGDSQPGSNPEIQVRGRGSFSSNGEPLYVVDGVPFNGNISMLNPADVESTVLLKDAASAALYGSRAANGVVLITTKSGKASKKGECVGTNVSVSARVGGNFFGVPDYDVVTDPREYLGILFQAYINANKSSYPFASYNWIMRESLKSTIAQGKANVNYIPLTVEGAMPGEPGFTWDKWFTYNEKTGTYRITDAATEGRKVVTRDKAGNVTGEYWLQRDNWADLLFRPGLRQEYNVSISGRGEKLSHYFSVGALDEKGYVVTSSFKRYTTRLRADYRARKWLNMGGNLSYTYAKRTSQNTTGNEVANPVQVVRSLAPLYPVFIRDADKKIMLDRLGTPLGDYGKGEYWGLKRQVLPLSNPVIDNLLKKSGRVYHTTNARAYTDFILPYGFQVTVNAAYDHTMWDSHTAASQVQGENVSKQGQISRAMSHYGTFNTQQLLTWSGEFGKHHIDALLGHEFYYYHRQSLSANREKIFGIGVVQINDAYGTVDASSSEASKGVEGYLARVNYDYAERYFLTASYRRDGSSNFARSKRWGNFGSVGLSWLISREAFMEPTKQWLNMLKLKASYGMQGNDKVNGNYYDTYTVVPQGKGFSYVYGRTGNPNLTWETSHNVNVGFESAWLGNRLMVNVDVFYKLITDMIFQRPLASSTGKAFIYQNIGNMSNTGVEFEITGVAFQNEKVRWSLTLNGAHITNKLTKLPPEYLNNKEKGQVRGSSFYTVGGPFQNLLIPVYTGVNAVGQSTWRYVDENGVESTTTNYGKASSSFESKRFIRNLAPKLFGGFGTSLDFYGFDFSASFGYQLGGHMYDDGYASLMHGGAQVGRAIHVDAAKAWNEVNDKSNIPALNQRDKYANATSTRFLISSNYFSIDNLLLGYTLPKKWVERIKLNSLRLYVVCDNVWLVSKRKGLDPRHTEYWGAKAMRSVSGGLTLTF